MKENLERKKERKMRTQYKQRKGMKVGKENKPRN